MLVESVLVDFRAPSRLALASLLLQAALPAAAQEYHVRQYTVEDGLPSAHVRGVTQDAEGRIWFATRSGIASSTPPASCAGTAKRRGSPAR